MTGREPDELERSVAASLARAERIRLQGERVLADQAADLADAERAAAYNRAWRAERNHGARARRSPIGPCRCTSMWHWHPTPTWVQAIQVVFWGSLLLIWLFNR
jgi:hypothetical protein